jgi:hypothetical protein
MIAPLPLSQATLAQFCQRHHILLIFSEYQG